MSEELNTYNPDYAVNPYDTLRECYEIGKIKHGDFYDDAAVELLLEYQPEIDEYLSPDLEKMTWTPEGFWLTAWKNYEQMKAKHGK